MKGLVKKLIRFILIIILFLLLCILAAWYFFAFDIHWGLTWQTFTWGFPLLASIISIMVCIYKFIRRRKWRWGLSGLGVAGLAIVYTVLILVFYSYQIVGEPENGPSETLDTEENRVLSLVLVHLLDDSPGYDVISPESSTQGLFHPFVFNEREDAIYWIKYQLWLHDEQEQIVTYGLEDETLSRLIEHFLVINDNPSPLTLKSSPQDGYYIDYDGKYSRYFDNDSGLGWLRMHLCRPMTKMTYISLPAYDPETGLVLMYIDTTSGEFTSVGHIYLMKIENEQLETLIQVILYRFPW